MVITIYKYTKPPRGWGTKDDIEIYNKVKDMTVTEEHFERYLNLVKLFSINPEQF